MTPKERKRLKKEFFDRCGPNTAAFVELINTLPDACFYIKDKDCRIMALNQRNCEVCNIKNELDVIGKRSDEVFPLQDGNSYMVLDREVMSTGKPVFNRIETRPADKSHHFMQSSVFPLSDTEGSIIGTMRLYKMITLKDTEHEWQGNLKKVAAYIQAHFTEELPIEMLSALAGISVSQFKRNFTKVFEMSPGRYIVNTRINHARKLLETTDMLLSDIALECGFYDQSHMTKAFKIIRKTTPGEYRRNHRSISSP